jgi:hypothetical protein
VTVSPELNLSFWTNVARIFIVSLPLLIGGARAVQAQFDYTTNADGISVTITGYTGFSFMDVAIPGTLDGLPVTAIGTNAFAGDDISSVTIPDSVTSIGDNSFYFCEYTTSITIGSSVTTIGTNAFTYCEYLTNISIPDSVISIGAAAFDNCFDLSTVTIGSNVSSIGDSAFTRCYYLVSGRDYTFGQKERSDQDCVLADID